MGSHALYNLFIYFNQLITIAIDSQLRYDEPMLPKDQKKTRDRNPVKALEKMALVSEPRPPVEQKPPLEAKPIVTVKQEIVPLVVKRQELAHIFYDAKLEDREQIRIDAKAMEWDLFSKVTSRFDTTKEVKVDHNITAMGLLGLLTGSDD